MKCTLNSKSRLANPKGHFGVAAVLVTLLATGCDSSETNECERLSQNTYTASTPLFVADLGQIALFELQQEIRTYESGSCELPTEGLSEMSLVIRNLTQCELSFSYRLSVFEGRDGSTVLGDVSIMPGAAVDEGVILRETGIRVDRSQFILTAEDVEQTGCQG